MRNLPYIEGLSRNCFVRRDRSPLYLYVGKVRILKLRDDVVRGD